MRKSNGAVAALNGLTAGAAQDDSGVSTPIEQHDCLLRPAQTLLDFLDQWARKELLFPSLLKFVAHIHQLNLRQGTLFNALA